MTKVEVLAIFAKSGDFLKPDEVLEKLRSGLDRRSFYSYLGRLRRQGLGGTSPFQARSIGISSDPKRQGTIGLLAEAGRSVRVKSPL